MRTGDGLSIFCVICAGRRHVSREAGQANPREPGPGESDWLLGKAGDEGAKPEEEVALDVGVHRVGPEFEHGWVLVGWKYI